MTTCPHDANAHPVRDDLDLLALWRVLAPRSFDSRILLMVVLRPDSVPIRRLLIQIDDLPEQVDAATCAGLIEMCERILHDTVVDGSIAMALGRRGTTLIQQADRDWVNAIVSAARGHCVALRTLHLATPDGVRAMTLDDVLTR